MCTSSVSNVIYHKFSQGAAFCALNGKNVNVMLELNVKCGITSHSTKLQPCQDVASFYAELLPKLRQMMYTAKILKNLTVPRWNSLVLQCMS